MPDTSQTIIELETRFWQAMVDNDADTATALLTQPAVMVTEHGALQFDHAQYRKMADGGPMVVTSFKFDDMKVLFPTEGTAVATYRVTQGIAPRGKASAATSQVMNDTSTWVKEGGAWKCVMHTETPAAQAAKA